MKLIADRIADNYRSENMVGATGFWGSVITLINPDKEISSSDWNSLIDFLRTEPNLVGMNTALVLSVAAFIKASEK
jgi:hypothetical protein